MRPINESFWLSTVVLVVILAPNTAFAQEGARRVSSSDSAVRATLEQRFTRIDEFDLTVGPAGLEGNFFLAGNLTPRSPRSRAAFTSDQDPGLAALDSIADLLSVDFNEFAPRKRRESKDEHGISHHRYDLTLDGWRVEGFELMIHIREDGTVSAANGHLVRLLRSQLTELHTSIASTSLITAVEARAGVLGDLRGAQVGDVELERVVVRDPPHLVWSAIVGTRSPFGSWKYHIDARTGRILEKKSLLQAAR